MGKLRWYKRDPNAALVGMRILSCEERGAYNTILDLIYANDGRLVDDDRYLAGECALSARSWKRIKERLVGLGKIRSVDGFVHNGRADKEVEFGLKKVETAQVAGRISAEKRKAESSKNNDLFPTAVGTDVPTESRINNHSQKKDSSDAGASEVEIPPRAAPKAKRAASAKTVLPETWEPEERHFAYALQNGFDRKRAEGMAEHFKAHHRAKGNRMLDWYAAWQTWVRNQVRFNERDGGGNGGGFGPVGESGGGPRGGGGGFSAFAAKRARDAGGKG